MYYFKFEIPRNADGTIAKYSPGWFGTIDKCPNNVTVLLYNDAEGYGIAQADDDFVPPEVTVLKDEEALSIVNDVPDVEGVFKGDSLVQRWITPAENDIEPSPEPLGVSEVTDG